MNGKMDPDQFPEEDLELSLEYVNEQLDMGDKSELEVALTASTTNNNNNNTAVDVISSTTTNTSFATSNNNSKAFNTENRVPETSSGSDSDSNSGSSSDSSSSSDGDGEDDDEEAEEEAVEADEEGEEGHPEEHNESESEVEEATVRGSKASSSSNSNGNQQQQVGSGAGNLNGGKLQSMLKQELVEEEEEDGEEPDESEDEEGPMYHHNPFEEPLEPEPVLTQPPQVMKVPALKIKKPKLDSDSPHIMMPPTPKSSSHPTFIPKTSSNKLKKLLNSAPHPMNGSASNISRREMGMTQPPHKRKRPTPKLMNDHGDVNNNRTNGASSKVTQQKVRRSESPPGSPRSHKSLVCDKNGIILAMTLYRCYKCFHISDTIEDCTSHYYAIHDDHSPLPSSSRNNSKSHQHLQQQLNHNKKHKAIHSQTSSSSSSFQTPTAPITSSSNNNAFYNDMDSDGDMDQDNEQDDPFNEMEQWINRSYDDDNKSTGSRMSQLKNSKGSFIQSPTPADYVPGRNAIKGTVQSNSNQCPIKGGYVTCAVCSITKYYASVQRRYGQFTCMGCAKFFGRFLIKPRVYFCPALGSCPLTNAPRCKACLLQACIDTYNIDDKRMQIVDNYRPEKRQGDNNQYPGITPLSLPTSQPSRNKNRSDQYDSFEESNMRYAPPPLIKSERSPPNQSDHASSYSGFNSSQSLLSQSLKNPSRRSNQVTSQGPKPSAARSAASSSLVPRKIQGCKNCANCVADDCGECAYCRDKPKFGGPNTLKKKCIKKKCLTNSLKTGRRR